MERLGLPISLSRPLESDLGGTAFQVEALKAANQSRTLRGGPRSRYAVAAAVAAARWRRVTTWWGSAGLPLAPGGINLAHFSSPASHFNVTPSLSSYPTALHSSATR